MRRKDLDDAVAADTDLSAKQVGEVVDAFLAAVVEGVASGERVTLSGFGTFEARDRAARDGRNPQTGKALRIEASRAAGFKPAEQFKRRLND